jgi:hypothetical protein
MRGLSWLLVFHGAVCLLSAFFPFYPPVFLFYWSFPVPFSLKLIIVLIAGAAQVILGIYWALNKWKIKWYWLATAMVVVVIIMLIFPITEGLFTRWK